MRSTLLFAAALLIPGSAVPAQPRAAPVQIINMYSYGYAPNPIVLAAGRPVTLTFVNRAGKGHDFTAEKFFRSSRILAGRVLEGEVDLAAGQSRSVTLVPAAGRYKARCRRPFHKMLGMGADIVVR